MTENRLQGKELNAVETLVDVGYSLMLSYY